MTQKTKLKGSCKDPFVYLGTISIILLGLVVATPSFFLNKNLILNAENTICSSESQFQSDGESFLGQDGPKKTEAPDLCLVQDNSLTGFSFPIAISPKVLGSLLDAGFDSTRANEVIEYEIQQGDTLTSIAEKFDISLNTILWANGLSKSSSAKTGQTLVILPVSGVLHHVKQGETVSQIAKKYKGDVNKILVFNELSNEGEIAVGDILVIPDGIMPVSAPAPVYVESTPVASSYFIPPISSPYRITQGLHWYNAIDFSHGKCGDSIFASAGGQVVKVKYGWNGGAGNYVTILHPNGVTTSYGHLQTILVSVGQQVSQGQIIAAMGGQPGMAGAGKSTGCHVHFSLNGARNPFAR